MIEKKFNFINYIIGFGIIVCAFLFSHLDSFAEGAVSFNYIRDEGSDEYHYYINGNSFPNGQRICLYSHTFPNNERFHTLEFISNTDTSYSYNVEYSVFRDQPVGPPQLVLSGTDTETRIFYYNSTYEGITYYYTPSNISYTDLFNVSGIRIFYDREDAIRYVLTGTLPERPFVDDLKLDDFKVNSFQWNNFVQSKFAVYWSNPRIANVTVRIEGTRSSDTFVGSSSPYIGEFDARDFANYNGDVITLIATPYDSNGSYGPSLMYTFTYNLNSPLGNIWRKIFKTPYSDHTIEIPYNTPSGNEPSNLPVEQVGENNCYYIYYNPTTNQYEIKYIYKIYNYPVIIYPDDATEEEVEETQNTIINEYNTTNYYNIINNIYNYDISYNDISYGDISSGDVETSYKDITGFFKGFSSFFAKLLSFFAKLFPFFPAYVTVFILAALGIIISLFLIKLFITIVKGFFLR